MAAQIATLVEEGRSGREIAVFYRTNAQSRVLEDVLVRQGVPYQVIGGPRFYERAEIKDVVAYLQVLDNLVDAVSLLRIANRPRRGIGDTSLTRLQTFAEGQGISLFEALAHGEEAGLAAAPLRCVRSCALLDRLRADLDLPVPEILERVLQESGYMEALEAERTIEAQGRIENLQELVGVAREYQQQQGERSLSGFLQEISLYSEQDGLSDEEGMLTPMTIHNAKGLEYEAVFIIGMEEGVFPHARSIEEQGIEEERRLCYVGMTRAKERLTLTHAAASLGLPELQPAVAVPRRAARATRSPRAAQPGVPGRRRVSRQWSLAAMSPRSPPARFGPAPHARRGGRHGRRAGRRCRRSFRGRRERAPAHARLRLERVS